MLKNIHEATRWLETTLRQEPGQERTLLTAVSVLSGEAQLAILLRSLLADRHSMLAAADQSYVHPLGFDKFTLATAKDSDYELSLHIWWPEQEKRVEDVHNHRFAFASVVLDGALEMQAFERADDGVLMQEYASPPGNTVEIVRFCHVGQAMLRCTLSAQMPTGTVYYTAARTLHRIAVANGGLTATLFLRGPIVHPSTTVFIDHENGQRSTIARPRIAPQSFGERVGAYVETLEARLAA